MKAANKALKKNDDKALENLGFSEKQIAELKKPDYMGRIGFASYSITNNNSNMKRVKDRIASLEKVAAMENVKQEFEGFTYTEEDNRCQFIFPGEPSEEIRGMLRYYAFKWSPSRGSWVRQLTGNGKYAAECVVTKLEGIK